MDFEGGLTILIEHFEARGGLTGAWLCLGPPLTQIMRWITNTPF